jgi:hypothetical protein
MSGSWYERAAGIRRDALVVDPETRMVRSEPLETPRIEIAVADGDDDHPGYGYFETVNLSSRKDLEGYIGYLEDLADEAWGPS